MAARLPPSGSGVGGWAADVDGGDLVAQIDGVARAVTRDLEDRLSVEGVAGGGEPHLGSR